MNKIIVITGASSGIGKETAQIFKGLNDIVINISRTVEENEIGYSCDVTNEEGIKDVFEKIYEKYGKIDALINNAGYGLSGASELLPVEKVRHLFDVNVIGTVICSKYAMPILKENGHIVNISSAMALFPLPFRTMYSASKAAVLNISYGMRMEVNDFKINVSAICPGDVKTNFTKNRVKFFETNEKYGKRIENAASGLDDKEEKKMPANKVASVIVKQCYKNKTKPMVIVGGKYKVLYFISRIVPFSWVLKVIDNCFGGN